MWISRQEELFPVLIDSGSMKSRILNYIYCRFICFAYLQFHALLLLFVDIPLFVIKSQENRSWQKIKAYIKESPWKCGSVRRAVGFPIFFTFCAFYLSAIIYTIMFTIEHWLGFTSSRLLDTFNFIIVPLLFIVWCCYYWISQENDWPSEETILQFSKDKTWKHIMYNALFISILIISFKACFYTARLLHQ